MLRGTVMYTFDTTSVKQYLQEFQQLLCSKLEQEESNSTRFQQEPWQYKEQFGGITCVLNQGNTFEKAAVNFSHIYGDHLPSAATDKRPQLVGSSFQAMGVSSVIHPLNPYVPTAHLNVRMLCTPERSTFWFGGGFDLTPYYPFYEDVIHWHTTAHNLCKPFGSDIYPKYKQWCDNYFYIKHRQETRGVGGLFFDDLNEWPFDQCFEFIKAVSRGFIEAYIPIVARRKNTPYGKREREFQLYRRGRYVEYNLVYDRGTLFGLQTGGRIESILTSLPPIVHWQYNWRPEKDSPEAMLYSDYLKPKDWLNLSQSSQGGELPFVATSTLEE